jgi:NAD(P)H dehydrogenase (quinone)
VRALICSMGALFARRARSGKVRRQPPVKLRGERPRSFYAEAAVTALAGTGHDGKTYELAGDHAYTLSDFAAEISRQTGRTIPYKNLPVPEYATALVGFGLPEAIAKAVASWDADAADGALFDNGRQLSALIGRPTTPLSTTVAEALAAVSKA